MEYFYELSLKVKQLIHNEYYPNLLQHLSDEDKEKKSHLTEKFNQLTYQWMEWICIFQKLTHCYKVVL